MEKRDRLRKLFFLGTAFFIAVIMVALTPIQGISAPKYGGTVRIAVARDADQLGDPVARLNLTGTRLSAPVVETLLHFDKKGMLVPWLATGWKVSKDLTSITFTLRKGVKFHDGTDLDVAALKWNLDRYRTSKNPELKSVKSIDIVDNSSVRINLSKWSSTLLANMTLHAGMIISPTAYKKLGPDKIKLHPVGTGPFQFKSWKRDVSLTFEKNPNYWQKGKPYLDNIEYVPIKNAMSRQAALKTGEVDGVMIVEFQFLKDLIDTGDFYTLAPGLSNILICWAGDSAHPDSPYADIRVRRALSYAVNRQECVDTINHGYGEPLNQYATKGSPGYNPNIKGYPYNPDKAKKLLAEAGYGNGLKIRMVSAGWGSYKYSPPAIQEYFRKIGVDAKVEFTDPGKHTGMLYNGWKDTFFHQPGRLVVPEAAHNLSVYASSMTYFKNTVLSPDDYLDAIKKAIEAPDFETKQKWTWEAQRLLVDKYCLVNFYFSNPRVHVFNKRVHDINWEAVTTTSWTPEDAWKD